MAKGFIPEPSELHFSNVMNAANIMPAMMSKPMNFLSIFSP